jgi:hypothetical protein
MVPGLTDLEDGGEIFLRNISGLLPAYRRDFTDDNRNFSPSSTLFAYFKS